MAGVTIKDLARFAGVHPSTVSLALANDPRLPETTRRRLQDLAARHRYRPNAAARWLRRARTGTIALVLWEEPQLARHGRIQGQLLAAVGAATAADYQVLVILASHERLAREPVDTIVHGAPVDGALFIGPTADRDGLRRLVQSGLPVVHYGRRVLEGIDLCYVSADYRGGARRAVEHLLSLGHRRIAALGDSRRPDDVIGARLDGYRDALYAAGLPVDPDLILPYADAAGPIVPVASETGETVDGSDGPDVAPAAELARRLRDLGATALFATTVPGALDVLSAARALGVRVPEDLSLVAFDDSEGLAQSTPPVTAVRQPTDDISAGATRLLLRLIDGEDVSAAERHHLLPTELVVRASSCPPRSS